MRGVIDKNGKGQHYCRTTRQRTENVQGQYQVADPERVRGQNIIVVDDIMTSGATMAECSRVLRHAGARTVKGVVLARTVK